MAAVDADAIIDPRLFGEAVALPTRKVDDPDSASDGEGDEGSGKRRKVKQNLWKCKQCRDARKKVQYMQSALMKLENELSDISASLKTASGPGNVIVAFNTDQKHWNVQSRS
jgi:hypothetical protein